MHMAEIEMVSPTYELTLLQFSRQSESRMYTKGFVLSYHDQVSYQIITPS